MKTLFILLIALTSSVLLADTIIVDQASTDNNPDGSSWAVAYPHLQDALAGAIAGDQLT